MNTVLLRNIAISGQKETVICILILKLTEDQVFTTTSGTPTVCSRLQAPLLQLKIETIV